MNAKNTRRATDETRIEKTKLLLRVSSVFHPWPMCFCLQIAFTLSLRLAGASFNIGSEVSMDTMHATTILAVRHKGKVAIGGDGQVTLGNVVMKSDAQKIRRLHGGKVLTGFAGASADSFALLERFEAKLKDFQGSVPRAATELAKDWRMDRNLRRLEAMMIALDQEHLLLVSGTGDVI